MTTENAQQKLFDSDREIQFSLRRDTGVAKIPVRFPTDDEWCDRSRIRIIKTRKLGRISEQLPIDSGPDLKLYEKIRLEGAPDLDGEEASYIVGLLARCEIVNVVMGDLEADVDLIVCGGVRVKHRLKIPAKSEEVKLNRSSGTVYSRPGTNIDELRIFLEPAGALWNRSKIEIDGYANGVPIIHKDGALRAVIEAASQDPDIEAEDFT